MKNKIKNLNIKISYAVFLVIFFLTIGYSSFKNEVSINDAKISVSPQIDIRVTDIHINDFKNNALSIDEKYNINKVMSQITLPNKDSEVIYEVKITNFGNIEQGIFDITGLQDNLEYYVKNIELKKDKICEQNRCINGVSKNIILGIRYKENGYNANNTTYNIDLDFDFRCFHKIEYKDAITNYMSENTIYPVSVMDGTNLNIKFEVNDPSKIRIYGNFLKLELDKDYTYDNSTFKINDIKMDLMFDGEEKTYLITKGINTYYKESKYKDKIENAEFVHYINTSHAVTTYDLSINKDESIIGWLELNENDNYDLYIGSEKQIALKDDSGIEMFAGLTNLKSVDFNNLLDTTDATSMRKMFYNVPNLESLDVSSFDTSKVTDMSAMFNVVGNVNYEKNDASLDDNKVYDYMGKLELSGVEKFDTSNVTNMEWMFAGIANSSIDIKDFNVEKVTTLKRLFSNCWNLESLDMSNWVTTNNTSLYNTFAHMHNMKQIDINNFDTSNVTTMRGMFNNNTKLENIIFPHYMDTSKVTNMRTVFANCTSLKHIDISSWNTNQVTTMQEMFANAGLEELNINFDTSKVTSMRYMFAGTLNLKELDLGSFNTSKVTDMYNMFGYIDSGFSGNQIQRTPISLEKLNISSFDTSNVTNMEGMFKGCISLKNLDVSHFNTSKVTTMREMFVGLSSVDKLDVSNFDTAKVTNMSYMFGKYTEPKGDKNTYYLDNATVVNVSNLNTSNVTNISYMFSGLKAVQTLDVSKFNTSKVTNMSYMFANTNSLKAVDVSNFNTSNVTSIDGLFQNALSLKTIDVSNFDTTKATSFRHMFSATDPNTTMSLEEIVGLKDLEYDNITSIESMLQRCAYIKELNFDDVTMPKVTSFTSAFNGMTSLERFTARNFNVPSVKSIFYFNDCPNIKYIDLTGFNGPLITSALTGWLSNKVNLEEVYMDNVYLPKVSNISNLLQKDVLLKKVSMKNSDFSSATTMSAMFSGCTVLESVDMTNMKVQNVTTMNSLFQNSPTLNSVKMKGMDISKVSTMNYVFNNCTSLTEVDLSNLNTSNVTSMTGMFQGATALKTVNLTGLNTGKVTNMSNMFYSGISTKYMVLEEIIGIEDINTSSVTNMSNMFAYNNALTSLNLSKWNTPSLTNMSGMFTGALKLETVDISNFDTSKVTTMANLFSSGSSNLMSIREIKGLEKLKFEKVTTASSMFSRCPQLEEVTLNINGPVLTSLQNLFYNDTGLKKVTLKNMNLPSYVTSSTFSSMFNGANNIEEINMSGLNAPGINTFGALFSNKKLLTKLDISNANVPSLNTMSSLFSGNTTLTNLNMSNMKTGTITNLSNTFKGCVALETIDLTGLNTSNVTTIAGMFYSGSDSIEMSLKTVVGLDKLDLSKVTGINDSFRGCRNIVGEVTLNMETQPVLSNAFLKAATNEGASLKIKYTDASSTWINNLIKSISSTHNITFEKV